MDIPYGFQCYAFVDDELKYFDPKRESPMLTSGLVNNISTRNAHLGFHHKQLNKQVHPFVRFTRKNEDFSSEQLRSLILARRLEPQDVGKKIFCGTKIQIGIAVVSSFLQLGLQYRKPIKGLSKLLPNKTWTGIVQGLTIDQDHPTSYDMAFGNFLAYAEEFPYMKFGPFYAIESKLVLLTGSSRRIEASSFGTNIDPSLWVAILALILILSLSASFLFQWQHDKLQLMDRALLELLRRLDNNNNNNKSFRHQVMSSSLSSSSSSSSSSANHDDDNRSYKWLVQDFFFIYLTMLLNKPSVEFDDLIWPKSHNVHHRVLIDRIRANANNNKQEVQREEAALAHLIEDKYPQLLQHYRDTQLKGKRRVLPVSIRTCSYIWSASCFVMASVYSGEMLAVILLHADQNVDTIAQLIHSKPPIEPLIRQDDFLYELMQQSKDENILKLHKMVTKIPRSQVYERALIESIAERKKALLGDDELIETIYDIYGKKFPLYRSKTSYLQYPISMLYRNDLEPRIESELRRGLVQIFEMGLIQRWNIAQKETISNFYSQDTESKQAVGDKNKQTNAPPIDHSAGDNYKPLTVNNFQVFFKFMLFCLFIAGLVLVTEIVVFRYSS